MQQGVLFNRQMAKHVESEEAARRRLVAYDAKEDGELVLDGTYETVGAK